MTEHTKEPWKVGSIIERVIYGADESAITFCDSVKDDVMLECANARRIVACVNYCRGLPTEGIETATALGKPAEVSLQQLSDVVAQRDQLKQQNEQVLAALVTLVEAHDAECSDTDRRWALVDARLAIRARSAEENKHG